MGVASAVGVGALLGGEEYVRFVQCSKLSKLSGAEDAEHAEPGGQGGWSIQPVRPQTSVWSRSWLEGSVSDVSLTQLSNQAH